MTINQKRARRFEQYSLDSLTGDQRTLAEEILQFSLRGLEGPFNMMLRSPEATRSLLSFSDYFRSGISLPLRLMELAVLVHARYSFDNYEWKLHSARAITAGLSAGIVESLRCGRVPEFAQQDEQVVFDFCRSLCAERKVSDDVFEAVREMLGEVGIVDLTLTMGQYNLVSLIISVSESEPVENGATELEPLDGPAFDS